jgi:hypothetical protein
MIVFGAELEAEQQLKEEQVRHELKTPDNL